MYRILFTSLFFVCSCVLASDDYFSEIPTKHQIDMAYSCAFERCAKQCASLWFNKNGCRKLCNDEGIKRVQDFRTRKFVAACQNTPSREQFNFKPTMKEKEVETINTNNAEALIKAHEHIARCVYELKNFKHIGRPRVVACTLCDD